MHGALGAAPAGTIGNADLSSVIELDTEFEDAFIYRPVQSGGDRLPDKNIKSLSLTDTAILDALRLLIKDTPVSLSMMNAANQNSTVNGTVTAYNLSGNLPDVVEKLSNSAGFYYRYSQGTLNIYPDEQFVVSLPPIVNEDVFAGMANTIQKLGASDTYLDRQGRTLTFRANRSAMRGIDRFLENVRETRSLIVFDTYIYEVNLTDGAQTGIKWNKLAMAIGPGGTLGALGAVGGSTVADSGGMGFSAIYKGSRFDLDAFFSFLQTQGNVKTIAQPKIAIMSGSKGGFKAGSTTKYVSQVGTNSSTTINQTTVSTDTAVSGLDLSLTGDVSDGTVYARIRISLSELIRFNSFEALGTSLQLPQTTSRELTTAIRARPGDVVLLGGVNNSSESSDYSGLPGESGRMLAPTSSNKKAARTELVMVMKPKIVRFSNPQREAEKLARKMIEQGPVSAVADVKAPVQVVEPRAVHPAPVRHAILPANLVDPVKARVEPKATPVEIAAKSISEPAPVPVNKDRTPPQVSPIQARVPDVSPPASVQAGGLTVIDPAHGQGGMALSEVHVAQQPQAQAQPVQRTQAPIADEAVSAVQTASNKDGSLVVQVKSGGHLVAEVNLKQAQSGENTND